MASSNDIWVVDRGSNLVNLKFAVVLYVAAGDPDSEDFTVWVNSTDPTGSNASAPLTQLTSHSDGSGMTEADAVTLLQEVASLVGVFAPGPAVGSKY